MQFLKKEDVKMLVIFSSLLYPVAKMTMSVSSTESSPSRTNPFLQKLKLCDFFRMRLPSLTLS